MAAKPKEAIASLQPGTPPVQKQYEGFTQRETDVNVSDPERWASSVSGGALAAYGLKKGGLGGLSLALLGGGLVYRGITGHCPVYEAVHLNTATEKGSGASVKHGEGIKVTRSVTIRSEEHTSELQSLRH